MEATMENEITRLFDESGMSISEFAAKSELKYSTAHDISTGKAKMENIGAAAFVRIAHVFGMTADELIGNYDEDRACYLHEDEKDLIKLFRCCSAEGKASVLSVAKTMAEME